MLQVSQSLQWVSLSVIFYIIYCYNNVASNTQSQTHSQSQKATNVESPICHLACIFYIINSYDNLTFSTQSLTHSQSQTHFEFQKTTIVESPIGMYNTYIAHLQKYLM